MDKRKLQLYFFLALLASIGGLTLWIIAPYLEVLVLAAAIAVIVHPIYRRFQRFTAGHNRIAALLTLGVAAIIILVPLVFFGFKILTESLDLYRRLSDHSDTYTQTVTSLASQIQGYFPGFKLDLSSYLGQVLNWVVGNLGKIFSLTIQTFFNFFIGIFALYYFLVDGRRFKETLIELSPLADDYDLKIIERLQNTVSSVIKGSLFVAMVQGFVSGLGFWIFGISDPTLWGSCAAIAALIPGVGTSIIIIPAVIYLALSGHYYAAVGLLIWGATIVGLIDNVIRPVMVGRDVQIHPFLVLISVFGGIAFFGPLGFIYGPLVLSMFYGLLDIYRTLILKKRTTGKTLTKPPQTI